MRLSIQNGGEPLYPLFHTDSWKRVALSITYESFDLQQKGFPANVTHGKQHRAVGIHGLLQAGSDGFVIIGSTEIHLPAGSGT
jgi:hypothetical protein